MRARATAPDTPPVELSRRDNLIATAMIILTPIFWAGHTVVGRLIAGEVPTFSLVSLRWWLCIVLFLPLIRKRMWASRWGLVRHWRYVLLNALLGPVLFPVMLYSGLKTTTVTNTSIIQALVPCMVPILAWLMLRDPFRPLQALGLALSLTGVATIVTKGNPFAIFEVQFVIGDLIMLGAFFMWALYTVVVRLKPRDLDPNSLLGATMVIAALVTSPLWIAEAYSGKTIPMTVESLSAIGYIAVFPTLLAYYFYSNAIAMVGPNKAGLSSHLAPPMGVLLGVIFLGEPFGPYHAVSFAAILVGVVLVIRGARASKTPAPT